MKLIEIKLNEFSTARKNPSLPLKKTVVKIWNEKWFEKKNHHHSTIQPFFDTTKKLNNNEKKMNSNPVWSQILKKNKFMYLKSTYPFFKYNSPKHCPISRKKNAFFASKIKKVVKQLLAKMILKKSHFGFPPISILTYPFSLQHRCAHFCLIFFIQISVKIDILLTFVSKLPIS